MTGVQTCALPIYAFEKKYGVKVNWIRNDSVDIIQRVQAEFRAGAIQADVYDGISGASLFKRDGMVQKFQPDIAKIMPKDYVDKDGFWIATSPYIHSFAYNTENVKKGEEPKSLEDLLDPKWKGQLALSGSPSTPGVGGFVGHVVTKMGVDKGTEYLKKLRAQNPGIIQGSARIVMDQVIAGEYKVGVQMLTHHAAFSSERGAPIEWTPTDDAMGALLVLGLFKGPKPNAGKLLIDFLLSDEGQKIFRDADYIPASPNVDARQQRLKPDGKYQIGRAHV